METEMKECTCTVEGGCNEEGDPGCAYCQTLDGEEPCPAEAADGVDPSAVRAEIARRGLHDLMPYWSPDTDSMIDPLDDPETKAEVRRFIARVWKGWTVVDDGRPLEDHEPTRSTAGDVRQMADDGE